MPWWGCSVPGKPYIAEVDRGIAVRKALEEAREGDVVVLAGKGHETYQILKDGKIDFDDRALRAKSWRRWITESSRQLSAIS